MQPNFALEDPETFQFVLPWSMITSDPTKGKEQLQSSLDVHRNSAKLLQEKVIVIGCVSRSRTVHRIVRNQK